MPGCLAILTTQTGPAACPPASPHSLSSTHPRTGGNKLHHFGEVLFMSVRAVLCGMNCFSDIDDF